MSYFIHIFTIHPNPKSNHIMNNQPSKQIHNLLWNLHRPQPFPKYCHVSRINIISQPCCSCCWPMGQPTLYHLPSQSNRILKKRNRPNILPTIFPWVSFQFTKIPCCHVSRIYHEEFLGAFTKMRNYRLTCNLVCKK